MTAIRSADGKVVQVATNAAHDRRLSLSARGLLLLMLSYPPDTTFDSAWLETQSPIGHQEVPAAIRELEERGYFQDGIVSDAVPGRSSRLPRVGG
jgi:hypothetical protein